MRRSPAGSVTLYRTVQDYTRYMRMWDHHGLNLLYNNSNAPPIAVAGTASHAADDQPVGTAWYFGTAMGRMENVAGIRHLVKRLRAPAEEWMPEAYYQDLCKEAADVIEDLLDACGKYLNAMVYEHNRAAMRRDE